jgi:rubrerythrin
MCQHGIYLQRLRRTLFQKLIGIKEVYVCSKCGHILKIK